jgi:hypothetical protein
MAEDKVSVGGILEKLALITDGCQNLFPEGNVIMVFELEDEDFKSIQKNFRQIDHHHKKFTINISEVELVFIHKDYVSIRDMEEKEEIPEPKGLVSRMKRLFSKSGKSSVKN